MFAILISAENLDKITERVPFTDDDIKFLKTCFNKDRYLVTGIETRGEMLPWSFLPGYRLKANFEYDANKIQTDWDQIVHH